MTLRAGRGLLCAPPAPGPQILPHPGRTSGRQVAVGAGGARVDRNGNSRCLPVGQLLCAWSPVPSSLRRAPFSPQNPQRVSGPFYRRSKCSSNHQALRWAGLASPSSPFWAPDPQAIAQERAAPSPHLSAIHSLPASLPSPPSLEQEPLPSPRFHSLLWMFPPKPLVSSLLQSGSLGLPMHQGAAQLGPHRAPALQGITLPPHQSLTLKQNQTPPNSQPFTLLHLRQWGPASLLTSQLGEGQKALCCCILLISQDCSS